MNKLSVKGFALGFGVSWGLMILFIGWAGALGWGANLATGLSTLYIGYGPTFPGGIIGAIWGFIDGLIGGAIIALVYNAIVKEKK